MIGTELLRHKAPTTPFGVLETRRVGGVAFLAPASFWRSNPLEILEGTGGCGPGKLGDVLIPDHFLFVSVKPACVIHDYMYGRLRSDAHKLVADLVFLKNLRSIVDSRSSNGITRAIRRLMAWWYYRAVYTAPYHGFVSGRARDAIDKKLFGV